MHREIIHLRHELGLKHRDISVRLGRTIGYVGTTLARAERYLREETVLLCSDHLGAFRFIPIR
jgi:DNA-directed RNA polymerase specialized sigma24 family protein